MMVLGDVLEYMVAARPGRSARELAMALHGNLTQLGDVEQALNDLVRAGRTVGRSAADGQGLVFHPRVRTQNRSLHAPSLLALFQSRRADLRLIHAQLFVEVAVQEGLAIETYARRLGLPEEVARRSLLDLAETFGRHGPQLALVRIDGRGRDTRCTLSLDGCRLLARLWDSMAAA